MKSTTKKIFFVLSAGWGPVMRTLPVANALKNLGLKTYFHVSGKIAIKTMSDAGHEFATPKSFPQTGNPKRDWWTLDQLLFDFGWNDQNFVESRFAAYYDVIKSIKPDVMIVDFNSTAMLVARVLKIPTVAIVHSCFHPQRKSPYIVWWKEPPSHIPTITPVINKILRKYGVNTVSCAEELQIGDITVIPSFPEFEPLSVVDEKTYYVGPIFDNKKNVKKNDAKRNIVVYPGRPRDMGGESGNLIMHTVLPVLERLDIPSIVSRGEFDYPEYTSSRGNISFTSWLSFFEMKSKIEILVHHGGHGACISSLLLGTPSLIIPTFAEREYNARNLEKLGFAISLPPEILSQEVVEHSISLLMTDKYKEKVNFWKKEISRRCYKGVEDVVSFVFDIL